MRCLLDWPIAKYIAKPMPELKFVGPPQNPGYYAIAFRKDEEELAEQFDAALKRLEQSGELRRIYEKWGIWNDEQQKLFDRKDADSFLHRVGSRNDVLLSIFRACCKGPWLPSS